jgi:hypothetical protein
VSQIWSLGRARVVLVLEVLVLPELAEQSEKHMQTLDLRFIVGQLMGRDV